MSCFRGAILAFIAALAVGLNQSPCIGAEPAEPVHSTAKSLCFKGAGRFSLCLDGFADAAYRNFQYEDENSNGAGDPAKDRFDVRKATLGASANVGDRISLRIEADFQGTGSRRLLDGYGEFAAFDWLKIRMGQMKEPFGLEENTKDRDLYFAERAMLHYLTPQRDVGLLVHGSLFADRLLYGVGAFNGDGQDDATGGNVDEPEVCARAVLEWGENSEKAPFRRFHLGGSASFSRIDRNNVDIHIYTAGRTAFFDVASNSKFNIILDGESKLRQGLEAGAALGPVILWAEYVHAAYNDLSTSSAEFDINLKGYSLAASWIISGGRPGFYKGSLTPVSPENSVVNGGLGAFGLALRYDVISANNEVYNDLFEKGISVKEARAASIALNWYLDRHARFMLDITRTNFDEPLLVSRDSMTGLSFYSDTEDVLTGLFQVKF